MRVKKKRWGVKPNAIFNLSLFLAAAALSLTAEKVEIEAQHFYFGLFLFWLFSILYNHLQTWTKTGKLNIEYGISYGLAFVLFAGPYGVFLYQIVYRSSVYLLRKIKNEKRSDSVIDTLYNIGAFTLSNVAGYYLFYAFIPYFTPFPFGFWLLILLLNGITMYISDLTLLTLLYLEKSIQTRQAAWAFLKDRSILDLWKTGFTNALLFVFLIEGRWESLIALFMLNYIVSRSFVLKSQNMQDKLERNQFEEMAYTDFLTGARNRAFMDKQMGQPKLYDAPFGVVVCDIDQFKKVNDTFNHAVGDTVIIHFAKLLQNHLEKDDCLFRTGGEEFTLFIRNRNYDGVKELVESLRLEVERSFVKAEFKGEPQHISYTASFGLFYKRFTDHTSIEKGHTYADDLLFDSKRTGRNRVTAEDGS
ncbi:GGDEF domain-containing protein [Sporosarcina sp. FSL K6-6792]|uniref:GGDEF domain-containing protein n=1 Tax=Sporosarcina sp. FSL K6-6792 TaxID=2921559 RepID=UPI0030FA6DEC